MFQNKSIFGAGLQCLSGTISLFRANSTLSRVCYTFPIAHSSVKYSIYRQSYIGLPVTSRTSPSSTNSTLGPYYLQRALHTTAKGVMATNVEGEQQSSTVKFPPKELKFDNPYGHTAAVEYGNPEAPNKILCVHGWLDNAGSFEGLIPEILAHKNHADLYHIVAFDMPGVGLSSHLPTGATYNTMTTVLEMRRIMQSLKWDKVTLLAHSMGSSISFLYASMYPKQVSTLISVDMPYPITGPINHTVANLINAIEEHFKCEYSHGDDPTDNMGVIVYSKQDAVDRIMQGHSNSLTRQSAEIMLKRGARKERWGYTFNRDVRLRYANLELRPPDQVMFDLLTFSFRANLFNILGSLSPYKKRAESKQKFYEMFEKKCPIFEEVTLEGTHHIHMNEPPVVAKEVNRFLELVREKGDDQPSELTLNKL